ncbi:MAG: dTDP-4-dehydrorhamnose reductase [Alistipes sp.]|nr:dTDP-4-dehydrorhamnose reductase [Alistipes sp.]
MSCKAKILVTGAKGQLGRELQSVVGSGWCFTDVDELDICSKEAVEAYVASNHIDTIVNCAAYTNVDRAEDEPQEAERINSDAVALLAEAARRHNIRLIHISTDYVFGGTHYNTPISEGAEPQPLGVYGTTKLMGERAVVGSGCRHVIIRTAWLYSPYGKNFVSTILGLATERDTIRVVSDQIGSPTYAHDLALVIRDISEGRIAAEGLYHYTNEGVVSWYEFARAIVNIAGLECKVEACTTAEYGAKAPRPAYSVLSKAKISSV